VLRLPVAYPELLEAMAEFSYKNYRVINFEMETSSLYGFGKMMGHNVASICVLLANRATGEYTRTIKEDEETLIKFVLDKMTE